MPKIRNFGFKRGDTVICKKNVYNDTHLVFKSGETYEVFGTSHFELDSLIVIFYKLNAGLSFSYLGVGENQTFQKFGDYFYTAQDIRRMKLENLKK